MFPHYANAEMTKKYLSCIHKRLQSAFDNTSLTLPNHITFLDVSNKHHVEHLHQNMLHVSSIIVQTHGQQTVVLMPPISEQHPYHYLLDSTGHFLFNKEIDLSASDSVLNYESRLAHATLYSIHLNPGDILLVPANWFIYRKSLSISVSMSLNYLSSDKWRLFSFQFEPMEQKHEHEHDHDHKYLTQEQCAVKAWADKEIKKHPPHDEYKIIHACKNIQKTRSDAREKVLNLLYLDLVSLPDAIFRIPHLKALDLLHNKLTSFSLSHMQNLVSLNLAANKLTSFSLNHMKNLKSLNLTNNQLTFFSLDHVENLTSLNVAFNQLLSFSLNPMKSLVSLNLSSNKLPSFSLSHMPKLASLNLAVNELTSFSLHHIKNLVSLDLTHNQLTSFSLSHVDNLISLYLAHNQLTSFSLSQMKALNSLDLSYNALSSFLSCNLPSVTHINLCHNHLSNLNSNCISSLNTNQRITLNLQDNPWSIDAMIQIYADLSKRSGKNVTNYPDWFLPITHIKRHAITYENFLHLLFQNNISPSSQNFCLKCPITRLNPCQVIFFVTNNKRYIIYDADALIQWMCVQWPRIQWREQPPPYLLLSEEEEEEEEGYTDPSTREPLTLKRLMSANELCVLQYLKEELGPVFTENMDLVHN